MQLRTFQDYSNTAPTCPFAQPVTLVNIDGFAAGAGYLQFFDSATAPSNAAVPYKAYRVAAAGPLVSIFQSLGPIEFINGMYVAFSSTLATYTADNTNFSIHGEVEEFEVPLPAGATVINETVTGSETIWADTAATHGLHRLLRMIVTNGSAAVQYLQLFCVEAVDGDVPIAVWKVGVGASRTLNFGTQGYVPHSRTAAGVLQDGCYLYVSTTSETLTAPASGEWDMVVYYV